MLSWKHFYEGIAIKNDKLNFGLHEFTHALHIKSMQNDKTSHVLFKEELESMHRANGKYGVEREVTSFWTHSTLCIH